MLIYNTKLSETGVETLWTRESLLAIRDFEKAVTGIEEWGRVCAAEDIE